jgi:hypothetical protein
MCGRRSVLRPSALVLPTRKGRAQRAIARPFRPLQIEREADLGSKRLQLKSQHPRVVSGRTTARRAYRAAPDGALGAQRAAARGSATGEGDSP